MCDGYQIDQDRRSETSTKVGPSTRTKSWKALTKGCAWAGRLTAWDWDWDGGVTMAQLA